MSRKGFETVSGDTVEVAIHESKWIELLVDDDPSDQPAKTYLNVGDAMRLSQMLAAAARELDGVSA